MASDQGETIDVPLTDPLQSEIETSQETSGEVPASPAHCVNALPTRSSQSSVQTSSTAAYERQELEAEEAFNQRIEQLCQDLWPLPTSIKHRFLASQAATRLRTNRFFRSIVPAPQMPLIQHLRGGGFNHITSITLPSSYDGGHRNLILRVPREGKSRPDQQVATLDYVRRRTSIPVATIEATDFTYNNAVGKPYVLQHRIPGRDLDSVWDELSHSQRCVVAEEVGRLIKTLLSVESPVAGTIEAATNGSYPTAELPSIIPFILTDAHGDPIEELDSDSPVGAVSPRSPETTLKFFEYYLSRWRKYALAQSLGETDCDVELYDDMLKVVSEMDALGLFKPDLNCLCHLDLHPRNVMVEICSEDSIQVTGILDWDEAVVAPKFVNCQPPGWLWGYDKDTHTESSILPWPYELDGANNTPSTLEQQELKCIFDELGGPEYRRLAYDESSRLMRGLYRVAILGLTASWHYTAAERIVKEWNILRPTLANEL
ncbi:MAG: hypothetical protein Q9175_001600 [Cornicularia normoerica]